MTALNIVVRARPTSGLATWPFFMRIDSVQARESEITRHSLQSHHPNKCQLLTTRLTGMFSLAAAARSREGRAQPIEHALPAGKHARPSCRDPSSRGDRRSTTARPRSGHAADIERRPEPERTPHSPPGPTSPSAARLANMGMVGAFPSSMPLASVLDPCSTIWRRTRSAATVHTACG